MWYYNGKLFESTPNEFQGFVYQLTEVYSNKKYIGKKNFWNLKFYPSLKHVRDVYAHVLNQTGKNTIVHQMKYASLWNNMEKKDSNVKY